VIPTYNIEKNINVINTNHTLSALKYRLENAKADKVLIFLNSVSGSASIIKTLGIADKSSLFTSTDAVKDFEKEYTGAKPKHLCSDLDIRKFSKYNFLTSRYFSAVEIGRASCRETVMCS